jgi:hypothetical protein
MELSKQAKCGKSLVLIGIPIQAISLISLLSLSSVFLLSLFLLFLTSFLFFLFILLGIVAYFKTRKNDYQGAGIFGFSAAFLFPALVLVSTLFINFLYGLLPVLCLSLGWLIYMISQKEKYRTDGVLLIALGFLLSVFIFLFSSPSIRESDIITNIYQVFFLVPLFLNIPMMAGSILCLTSPEARAKQKADSMKAKPVNRFAQS